MTVSRVSTDAHHCLSTNTNHCLSNNADHGFGNVSCGKPGGMPKGAMGPPTSPPADSMCGRGICGGMMGGDVAGCPGGIPRFSAC